MDDYPAEHLQAELLPIKERQVPATSPSRKRQIDSDSDIDNEPLLKRARLTRKNLARFDKMGKNKTESMKSSSSYCDSTSESQSTRTTSTTTSGFAIQAWKNGILHPSKSKPPTNLEAIQERHSKSRATASPTESEYRCYSNRVEAAYNEATMVYKTSGKLLKDYDDEPYHQSFKRSFSGFPKDVGFNDSLSAPRPDFVEGLEMEEYDPFPVDEHVSGAVLYDDGPRSITLPHIAGEWKGRGENMEEARMQSAYDGAALVYSRSKALSYMGKSDPLGHAEVTTFTTDGTTLNQYAHYAEESEDGTTKYHQCRIKSINLIDCHKNFKDGYKQLRNAQDHARDRSYALKNDLKEFWKQQRSTLQPITEGTPMPVADSHGNPSEDTNLDEKSYDASACIEINTLAKHQSSSRHPSSNHSIGESSSKHSSSESSNQTASTKGHKRKASQPCLESRHANKRKSYWNLDAKSGRHYHRNFDGTTSWFGGEQDKRD